MNLPTRLGQARAQASTVHNARILARCIGFILWMSPNNLSSLLAALSPLLSALSISFLFFHLSPFPVQGSVHNKEKKRGLYSALYDKGRRNRLL